MNISKSQRSILQEVCSHLQNAEVTGIDLLKSISAAVNVYVNYTGTTTCYNTQRQAKKALGDRGWDFQVSKLDSLR